MLVPRYLTQPFSETPVSSLNHERWRYVAMAMLFAGGGLIEFGLVTGLISTSHPGLVQSAATMFIVLAFATAAVTARTYRHFTRVVVAVTIIEISVLAQAFDGISTVPIYYVWPLLGAAYLLTRTDVVVFSAMSVVGCALGATSPQLGTADYISVGVVSLVVIVAVRVLAENLGLSIRSLRKASRTDPLTGLLNRRAMDYYASEELRRAGADRPLTVLVLDIDHFKQINDRYGHAVGDAALVRFSELLIGACRGTDRIARIGGEEFAVLMPGASSVNAHERATLFADRLRADRSVEGLRITVSGGIATTADASTSWDDLQGAADGAVYQAKRAGRDRIVVTSAPTKPEGQPAGEAHTLRRLPN